MPGRWPFRSNPGRPPFAFRPVLTAILTAICPRLPVLTTAAVPSGQLLAIDSTALVSAVGTVQVAVSQDYYFNSDSIALRCTWRFGANLVHPDRIARLEVGDLS